MKDVVRRVTRLAARQFGVVTTAQLLDCGLSRTGIARLVERGWLHRIARGIYAVGNPRLGQEGELSVCLLQGGPGAALSHLTGAWWWELLRYPAKLIHVSAPGRRSSNGRVRIHHSKNLDREWHRGLPVVSPTLAIIQIAPICSPAALRRAVAQADYRGRLDRERIEDAIRRRLPGAPILRRALDSHLPELADTLGSAEDRLLLLCEEHGVAIPKASAEVAGYVVDAYWPETGLVVEVDERDTNVLDAVRDGEARDVGRTRTGPASAGGCWGRTHKATRALHASRGGRRPAPSGTAG
jgi:hypothetical protein